MTRGPKYKAGDRVRFVSSGAMFGSTGTVKFVRKDGHLIVHLDGQPEDSAMFADLTDMAPEARLAPAGTAGTGKSGKELERDIREALAAPTPSPGASPRASFDAPRPSLTVRQINAIARAADGRNIYLIRERLGEETVQRVTRARTKGRETEVRALATGHWLPMLPERGDRIEVR